MKKQFNCLLDEEVVAEIKRKAVGKVTQAEVVRSAILGEPLDAPLKARVEKVEQALVMMGAQMPEPPSLELKSKEERDGILFKRMVSEAERDGLVVALKRMREGGDALQEQPDDRRLEKIEAMVGKLVETMDRLVDLMIVADMDQGASELAEPKVSQEGARLVDPKKLVDEAPAGDPGDHTGQAPAPSGAKVDPRSLGLTPEQVKSFGLKTGADLVTEEELPDDPQTPVQPEEEPKPANQIRGISKKEGGQVMGKVIDDLREEQRTIGIPVAHLLGRTKEKPVVPQFNQVKTIDRSTRQPLLRPNGRL